MCPIHSGGQKVKEPHKGIYVAGRKETNHRINHDNKRQMKKRDIIILFALVLSITAAAQETIFPAKFTAPAEYNTGTVHISVLSRSEHQMTTNFLFERGSHNSWHYHPNATQVLMVLNGEAYYQEEGKPKQLLRKGDVVTTAPNVRHWNGATPWSDCECMTVSDLVPGEEHAVQLRKVTDEEFSAPVKNETAAADSGGCSSTMAGSCHFSGKAQC